MLYRSVEVYVPPDTSIQGPTIVIANHFGGFADALLVVYALDDVPRILARDKIWKIPLVRGLMRAIRAIPVHKPEDRTEPTSNRDMFGATYDALAHNDTILIFPEGITVDDPSMARLKTGAARIALGARAHGVEGITIVPIGIHYEDKAALRSRVSVIVGDAMDLDDPPTATGSPEEGMTPENRRLVRTLTARMEERLRNVAPNFADWKEANDLTFAAEATIRAEHADPLAPVSTAERDRLAGKLAVAEAGARRRVIEAVERYRRDLEAVGLTDRQAHHRTSTVEFALHVAATVLVGAILIPFALIGIATSAVPLFVVLGIGLLPVSPAVKATLKPVAAIVLFPLAWGIAAWRIVFDNLGPVWTFVTVALIPLYLVAGIVITERLVLLWRAFEAWHGRKGLSTATARISYERARVVEAVRAAT